MIDNLRFYLIVERRFDRVVGYAAYGTADFVSKQRRGLRVKRHESTKLMSNVYFEAEGDPPGFGICDEEEVKLYQQGLIRYRAILYELRPAPDDLSEVLWEQYLGESWD